LPKVFVNHIADLARWAEEAGAGGGHVEMVRIVRVLKSFSVVTVEFDSRSDDVYMLQFSMVERFGNT
jgi:hypothetical protein